MRNDGFIVKTRMGPT